MQTVPSIESLAGYFACQPRIEATHPDFGVLKFELEYNTEHESVSLSVLPVAEEIDLRVFTKAPSRFFLLRLEDVREIALIKAEKDREVDEQIQVHFHNTEVQSLSLRLRPVFMLTWGNQHNSPERLTLPRFHVHQPTRRNQAMQLLQAFDS